MIQLKDTRHQNTSAFLESAVRIAQYYGFSSLDELPRSRDTEGKANRILSLADVESQIAFARRDERTLLQAARRSLSCARRDGVLLAWRVVQSPERPSLSFELHILGPNSAIAEALLLVVASAIIKDAGISNGSLAINNIGSSESNGRYVRDVGLYLRKHIETISPTLRPRAATDPLGTLVQLIERGHPAAPRAPQAMEYLTEEERTRFWELLEYLEMFGLPYELNPHILGSRDCWAQSLFEIGGTDAETGGRVALAFGGRYDPLMSRFVRTPSSAAMIGIACEIRGKTKAPSRTANGKMQPGIYFAHLGLEARRRALSVLENLRAAEVPVHQGIWQERIGEQMAAARRLGVPYILIMGHKEAMEGTILVREVATNSQEAIPLSDLPGYLRRHRVGPVAAVPV